MLFIESKTLACRVDEAARLRLLDELQTSGFTPLIRSTRRRAFELLCAPRAGEQLGELVAEFERHALAARTGAYTPGELFCTEDHVLFLIFNEPERGGINAGIIFDIETGNPLHALDLFCQKIQTCFPPPRATHEDAATDEQNLSAWETQSRPVPQSLARFIAIQDSEVVRVARCREGASERLLAAELLQDRSVRDFLSRAQEARREGYAPRMLKGELSAVHGASLERLTEAGLLQRDVRVSCRQTGHALFDLPSADALALITLSRAKCSLCAAAVADEVVEEVLNPTPLAAHLLSDSAWLANLIYQTVRQLGLPDSEIVAGPASAHGESHLIANVCGDSFLFVIRDGDLSPAFARRIVEAVGATEPTHLAVVVNGQVEELGRIRLYEYVWRRARAGHDFDVMILEGINGVQKELERAFARAVRRALARQLFPLDASLGVSASDFVLARFKLLRPATKPHVLAALPRPAKPQQPDSAPRMLTTDVLPFRAEGTG